MKTVSRKRAHWLIRSSVLLVVSAIAAVASPAIAGCDMDGREADWRDAVSAEIGRTIERNGDPGAIVLVVTADCVIMSQGFGVKELDEAEPVASDTLFRIGSNTKVMTALGIGLLADRGLLAFDQPVHQILSDFDLADDDAREQVTVDHLLSHRTGMSSHTLVWYGAESRSVPDLVRRLRHLELSGRPGRQFSYNNLGYIVAGALVPQVTGTSYETFMSTQLFEPLGMTQATFDLAEFRSRDSHAAAHARIGGVIRTIAPRPLGPANAAGGLAASLEDMAPYLQMLAGRGALGGRQVFPAALINELMEPRTQRNTYYEEPGAGTAHYGYGFNVDTYGDTRRIHHTGSIDGYRSRLVVFPDLELGVFVATNLGGSPLPEIATNLVSDRLLGRRYFDWAGYILGDAGAATQVKAADITVPAKSFDGRFCDAGYGCVEVLKGEGEDGGLVIGLNSLTFLALPTGISEWRITGAPGGWPLVATGTPVTAERDAQGDVFAITIGFDRATSPVRFIRQ